MESCTFGEYDLHTKGAQKEEPDLDASFTLGKAHPPRLDRRDVGSTW